MKTIESSPKKPKNIGLRDLRLNTDEVINAVKKGQSYFVHRKSEAVFKIVPVDEEVWNTVINFTEIDESGVEINDVLSSMESLKKDKPSKYGRQN